VGGVEGIAVTRELPAVNRAETLSAIDAVVLSLVRQKHHESLEILEYFYPEIVRMAKRTHISSVMTIYW
jgi:hypothetical protein